MHYTVTPCLSWDALASSELVDAAANDNKKLSATYWREHTLRRCVQFFAGYDKFQPTQHSLNAVCFKNPREYAHKLPYISQKL